MIFPYDIQCLLSILRKKNLRKSQRFPVYDLFHPIADKRFIISNQKCTEGFRKDLEIQGVGYRAAKQGSKLTLTLGFSHPVEFEDTDTIKIELKDALHFSITGIDKQEVGQFAAEVRGVRPPEPYKGKGIRYVGEYVIRKEGKAGKGK